MNKHFLFFSIFIGSLTAIPASAQIDLTGEKPIALFGAAGKFDFMEVDPVLHRLLAAHPGAKRVELIDLTSKKPLQALEIGEAQGIAVDAVNARYFFGNDGEQSVVIFDSRKLKKIGEVKVDGPVDAVAYDSKNDRVYAAKDDGTLLWIIDPKALVLTGTVLLTGVPEVLQYDVETNALYLNIKDKT